MPPIMRFISVLSISLISSFLLSGCSVFWEEDTIEFHVGISDQLDTLVQLNTHEGLVGFDEYMQIQPRIAKSWGSLDDTTWQFILRPGVLFHDGSLLTMQDVVLSIQASTLAQDLILTQKNETHLQIQTQTPDNLLLFKLTSIPISQRITGVGTGPFYQNTSDQQVVLSRFDQYWGDAGVFARVVLHQIEDKFERTQQFLDGDLDVLIGIPPEILGLPDNLKTDFQLIAKGWLETKFFLLNDSGSGSIMHNQKIRQAAALALDRQLLLDFVDSDHVHLTDQPVPSSIGGYDAEYIYPTFSEGTSAQLLKEAEYENGISLDIAFASDLQSFASVIQRTMKKEKILGNTHLLNDWEFVQSLQNGDYQMYFLGWNFQEGNVEEFLQGLKPYLPEYLYSSGITVNSLLDQYYIVPFIEEEKLYVIQNEYEFLGRQDGLIYIPDVRL